MTPWTIQSMEFSRPEYWSGQPFPSPGDLPNPVIQPESPALQADSLPAEPRGKPRNTGVGSLSLLQRIFLTQESNWGLLHCRQILYQLSSQGSPQDCTSPSQILETGTVNPSNGCGVISWVSLIAQLVKNPPAKQDDPVRLLGQEDPLEKG